MAERSSRNQYRLLVVLALAALVAASWTEREPLRAVAARLLPGDAKPRSATASPAVPVTVATAHIQDFPIYLDGLGTVQAENTVTVHSQVDGALSHIDFAEGQTVVKGDVIAEIDPRPLQAALDEAKAKLSQDQASLANARADLDRYSKLATEAFASRQQLDTQRALVDQLTAQIRGDEASIAMSQTELDYATIRSPLTGRAGFRTIDEGNIVHATDTTGIVTITQVQPIAVIFSVPEDDVPAVNAALKAGDVTVVALSPGDKSELDRGRLSVANNAIDIASGTLRLKATFPNASGALWPGQSVGTRLLLRTLKSATVVSENAVQHGPDGLYAYVVGTDDKASLRRIAVATQQDGAAVVTQGLAPGDKTIVDGAYRVQPGTLVRAEAAPDATKAAQGAGPPSPGAARS